MNIPNPTKETCMPTHVQHDAAEFGVHVRQGGWRLGLLVARCVEVPKGQGARTFSSEKVSANEFATLSETSASRVLRYLKAWDRAADAGVVPKPSTLSPGAEVALNVESLPDWNDYYPPAGTDRQAAPREVVEHYAREAGTTPGNVARVANNPAAVGAAIKASPAVAAAAMKALDERYDEAPKPIAPRQDESAKPVELVYEFRRLHRGVDSIISLVIEGKAVVSDAERDAILREVQWLRTALGYIEDGVRADSLDVAIAQFMDANS